MITDEQYQAAITIINEYQEEQMRLHEETFIHEQYIEQGMKLPDENTDFMKKVREQAEKLSKPEEKLWK